MASSQALTSQTWRLVLLVVLAGMPLTLDPYGLHPFSVPKQAGLIAGAALAFFLWALAWAVKADAVQVDREARWLMILANHLCWLEHSDPSRRGPEPLAALA